MKRMNLFFTAIFLIVCSWTTKSFAQMVYEEDFSGPAPYNILKIKNNDGNADTWTYASRFRAFANALIVLPNNALRSITYSNTGQADDWIMLPKLSIPSNALLTFEFHAETEANAWNGYPNLEVKISTTDTLLPSYTTIKTITKNFSHFTIESADLSAYSGLDVYIAIVNRCLTPSSLGWKRIYVDNIQVGVFHDHDLQGFTFIPSSYGKIGMPGTLPVSFVNRGNQTLTSMDLHYRVNNGPVVSSSVSGLNVQQFDTLRLDHPIGWTPPAPGSYTVKFWADNLNGNSDGDKSNDTLVRQYTVYSKVTKKRPLLEIFSGANCSACAPLAKDIDRFVEAWDFNAASGHLSCVEYQTYTTDPSDNADAQIRDVYYSVSGYPDEHITESYDYKNLLFDNSLHSFYPFIDFSLSKASVAPAFIEMEMDVQITGNAVAVTVDALPLKNFTGNAVMHIVVTEKKYTYTGGMTGQTVFKHVMRKMLPNGNGTALGTLADGVPVSITQSYTFTIGNVTEGSFNLWGGMNNIEVLAFIQNPNTKEVYQSVATQADDLNAITELPDGNFSLNVYPIPAENFLFVQSLDFQPIHELKVLSVSGSLVMCKETSRNLAECSIDISYLSNGLYFLSAYGTKGELIGYQKFIVQK